MAAGNCTRASLRALVAQVYESQLNRVESVAPDAETLVIGQNNLLDYSASVGATTPTFNIPDVKAKYTPVRDAIKATLEAGKSLFTVKDKDRKSSTFMPLALFKESNAGTLIDYLMAQGLNQSTAALFTDTFHTFSKVFRSQFVPSTDIYYQYNKGDRILPLLFSQIERNGKSTQGVPSPVLFSATSALLRWVAADGQATKSGWTDEQVKELLDLPREEPLPYEIWQVFMGAESSGVPRDQTAAIIGRMIWDSLNIQANIGEYSSDLQADLSLQLGHLALEIGDQMGLVQQVDINIPQYDVNVSYYRVFNQSDVAEDNNFRALDLKTEVADIKSLSNELDAFFGVQQNFNDPSSTPYGAVSSSIRGSLGKASKMTRRVVNKLLNSAWVPNESFALFRIGLDTENAQLKELSNKLRQQLAGVVDPNTKHVDQRPGVEAKNQQLIQQIDAIQTYTDMGIIDRFYVKWRLQRQHRMMINGPLNPQDSKIHRFLFKSEQFKSFTFDPKDEAKLAAFQIAVAQHFDQDVDKTDVAGSVELFETVFADMADENSALSRAVNAAIQLDTQTTEEAELAFVEAMLELSDKYPKANTALLSAVQALAKYQTALNNGTTFDTDISVEADAVTSGYGLGLLMFAGSNTEAIMKELNRVGVTFEGEVPYSERVKSENAETYPDGYLNFANALFDYISQNAETAEFQKIVEVLGLNNHKARRKAGKPPFMVLGYGGGPAKVTKEFVASLVDDMLSKITSLEAQYATADAQTQTQIESDMKSLLGAMNAISGVKMYGVTKGKTIGQMIAAKAFTRRSIENKGKIELSKALQEMLTETVEAVDEATNPVKIHKDNFVQAVELQYMIFKIKFDAKVAEVEGRTAENITNRERLEIAKELLADYPLVSLPGQDGQSTFIDLIKTERSRSKNSPRLELPLKGSKSIESSRLVYSAPGSSALVRTVQGRDATNLQSSLLDFTGDSDVTSILPIHDAILGSVGAVYALKDRYNAKYVADGIAFDPFAQVMERLEASLSSLTPEQRGQLIQKFKTESYNWKMKGTKTPIRQVILEVRASAAEVAKGREALAGKLDTATIEHMYLPDGATKTYAQLSLDLETHDKDYRHVERDREINAPDPVTGNKPPQLFNKDSVGSSLEDLLQQMQTWHNNVKASTSTRRVFSDLGNADVHYDSGHASHLETILDEIILKHMRNVEDVVIETGFVDREDKTAVGGFNERLRKVVVQLSNTAPKTYTQQAGQEVYVHELLHAVMDQTLDNDARLTQALAILHKAVMEQITVEDLMDDRANSGATDLDAERQQAQEMYDYIKANPREFLMYALTNKALVKKLRTLQPNTTQRMWEGKSFLDRLLNFFKYVVERFQTRFQGKRVSKSQYDEFYNFALKVSTINHGKQKSIAALAKEFHLTQLAELGWDKMSEAMLAVITKTGNVMLRNTPVAATLSKIKALPPAIRASATAKAFDKAFVALSSIDQVQTMALLAKDIFVGVGSVKASQLLLRAKALIDSQRLHRAKSLVSVMRDATQTKNISTAQQVALTKVLLKTDLRVLFATGAYSIDQIINLIKDPDALDAAITAYQNKVGTPNNTFYAQQTDMLAQFMVTGTTFSSLQGLNAARIYQLNQQVRNQAVDVQKDAQLIKDLDVLTTLKALRRTSQLSKDQAIDVIDSEVAGNATKNLITETIKLHKVNHENSMRANFGNSPFGMIKGYTRASSDPNVEIVAAPIADEAKLKREGFVLEKQLSDVPGITEQGYAIYVNKYNPEPTRTTGVISYTGQKGKGTSLFEMLGRQEKYQITDPETGVTSPDPKKIKPVIDQYIRKQIAQLKRETVSGKLGTDVQLVPMINEAGDIYDFRVMMSHNTQESLIKPDLRLESVMGQMEMHYVDKKATKQIEDEAVQYMVDTFNSEYKGKQDRAFINLLDEKHINKYFAFFPRSLQQKIKDNAIVERDGTLTFPVKREELRILVGHKDLSIANIPGFTKLPAVVRKSIKGLEQALIALTNMAAVNIIIKIPNVILDNALSNTVVLTTEGMNPVAAITQQMQAAKDLRVWKNDAAEYIRAYYEYQGNGGKDAKLRDKMDLLRNKLENSPITELMDENLFTSMVEEIHLNEYSSIDSLAQKTEDKLSRFVPNLAMSAAKHLYMTKTTAPFQAIQEVFQMSDFVARVALNNHLKAKRPDLSKEQRLQILFDQFALYDIPGQSRLAHYMNKTGFIMFYRYWYKIQRAVFKTAIRRPKSILTLFLFQSVMDIDVPDIYDSAIVTGNFLPPIAGPMDILDNVIGLPGLEMADTLTDL